MQREEGGSFPTRRRSSGLLRSEEGSDQKNEQKKRPLHRLSLSLDLPLLLPLLPAAAAAYYSIQVAPQAADGNDTKPYRGTRAVDGGGGSGAAITR